MRDDFLITVLFSFSSPHSDARMKRSVTIFTILGMSLGCLKAALNLQ